MDTARLVLALGLPWLLGALIVDRFVTDVGTNRRLLVAGYGYMAGVLIITLTMRSISTLQMPLNPETLIPPLLIATALLAWLKLRLPPIKAIGIDACTELSSWQKIILALLLFAIITRIVGLWLEVSLLPLFPWDAFMHWATKSKVWTHAQTIVPFVHYDEWLARRGAGVYTDNHPAYPITIPLLQTWINLILGRWDDALMNLPWALLLAAGAMMFFAQIRRAGLGLVSALFFTYLLISMPIINLQVALAGYADIFLGFFYLAAVMAFYHWVRVRGWANGTLAVAFALSCPLIKNEGLFWSLTFLSAMAAVFLPRRWLFPALASAAALLLVLVTLLPDELRIAGHSLSQLQLGFRVDALLPLVKSFFVFDNWHLLFWILAALLGAYVIGSMRTGGGWPTPLLSLGMVIATAMVLLLVLFVFTEYAGGAVRHTADSRITLHLAPSLMFFSALLFRSLTAMYSSDCRESRHEKVVPVRTEQPDQEC